MFPIDLFWRAADRWPDNIAIDAPDGRLRYRDLASHVASLAAHFLALDPAPQSRVGICAGNSAQHIVALLAVLASGKIWVPLNPKSTQPELRRIVSDISSADIDSALRKKLPRDSGTGKGGRVWDKHRRRRRGFQGFFLCARWPCRG